METTVQNLLNAVALVKRAFGAPGDHGYNTDEGKALFALYAAASDAACALPRDEVQK